ncbi:MAG: hypothetical protein H6819_04240 [Phycisphaerales bacterium]|nr:hypothetical protein [Phycisphaerales bacterium]MCB9856408.1 hypothetical protein [Phycisphaerales bacterium]MCB9864539.1 hypothetical protein [Phycisphaerales bacterium]
MLSKLDLPPIVGFLTAFLVTACFSAMPEKTQSAPPGRLDPDIECLARLAATSTDVVDYVATRDAFLRHPQAETIRFATAPAEASVRYCVVVDAWKLWASDYETADQLWAYRPIPGNEIDPSAKMWRTSLGVFQNANDAGVVIAREILLFRHDWLYIALITLLSDEGSGNSIDVLIEAMFDERTCHSAFANIDASVLSRLLDRFEATEGKVRTCLLWTFAMNRYRPAARICGEILLSFERTQRSMHHDELQYNAYSKVVGGEYVFYFERIAGRSFHRRWDSSEGEAIDRAKEWWLRNKWRFADESQTVTHEGRRQRNSE